MADSFETITIPEPKTADISYGYDSEVIKWAQIDPTSNRKINQMQYYALDVWWTWGAAWDTTYRIINLIGLNGDRDRTYSEEIIQGLGSTTARITKTYTIDTPVNGTIKVPPWAIFRINSRFSTSTQTLRMTITGSYRFLLWSANDLTSSNPSATLINASNTSLSIYFRFQTTAAERPVFWFFVEIFP
jgi:hypothetical protein